VGVAPKIPESQKHEYGEQSRSQFSPRNLRRRYNFRRIDRGSANKTLGRKYHRVVMEAIFIREAICLIQVICLPVIRIEIIIFAVPTSSVCSVRLSRNVVFY